MAITRKKTKLRLDQCDHLGKQVVEGGKLLFACGAGPVHYCNKREERVTPQARCSKYHSCYGKHDDPPLQYCGEHESTGKPVFVDLGLPAETRAEIIAKQDVGLIGKVNLRQFYDAVYIINRRERTDRWESCQKQFLSDNWPFQAPIRVEAVEGDSLTLPGNWKATSGAYGCLQSHIKVCDMALAAKHDKILVLEDDFRLAAKFPERAEKFISQVPDDWQGIWLGGSNKKRSWDISDDVVRLLHSVLAHAYSLRGEAIKKYRDFLSSNSINRDFDTIFANVMPRYKIYAPRSWLVFQSGSSSDNRDFGQNEWKKALEESLTL